MARVILLGSGPLGEITHPGSERRRPIREWLFRLLNAGIYPRLPEIVDYEHRRTLLRRDAYRQIERLNAFKQVFGYEPLTTEVMLTAAELWADVLPRNRHVQTQTHAATSTSMSGSTAFSKEVAVPQFHELSRGYRRHRRVFHAEDVLVSAYEVGGSREYGGVDVRVIFGV